MRRLDHAGIAADQSGQQLPGRNRHGEVPGRDHAADAERLTDRHREFIGQLRRSGRSEETTAFAGHVVGGIDGFLHVAAGFFDDLAHFAGHVAGEFFFALEQDFGGAIKQLGAAGSRDQTPLQEGTFGSVDGGVNVCLAGLLEDGYDLAGVGGIAVLKRLTGNGFDPLSVNEVLENAGADVLAEHGGAGQSIGSHKAS